MIGVLALVAASCSSDDGGGGDEEDEILIGASTPQTGDRSEPGEATMQGYQVWEELVNEDGGILGRPVRVIVQDDGSDTNRVRSNYQALIDQENVDALLGTFSSLQNEPASAVAEQNEMVFICPSCGNPELFERGFQYYFFAQPAISVDQANLFAEWVAGLPEGERPETAAYPTLDDPFAAPVIEGIREKLEAVGITTVYNEAPYAEGTSGAAMDSIANAIAETEPDLVAHGSIGADGIAMVQSMQRVDYNPQILFQTTAPSLGDQYSEGVGLENTEGIFYAVSWSPDAATEGNEEFVQRYEEKFGGTPPEDAANGFGAAQVLQAAIEGVGGVDDQQALADWLHENTVETNMGPLSWDENGAPQSAFILAQWQDGESKIVLPRDVADSDTIVNPKPDWGGAPAS
jgi:branched-chain amino acid transport system substrate-binding protein